MEEGVVRDCLGEGVERDVVGWADARYADRVRTYAKGCLQMLRMHHQSDEVIAISTQAKEYSQTYIVDAPLHCSIHRLGMIGVVALRTSRV